MTPGGTHISVLVASRCPVPGQALCGVHFPRFPHLPGMMGGHGMSVAMLTRLLLLLQSVCLSVCLSLLLHLCPSVNERLSLPRSRKNKQASKQSRTQ